MPLSAIALASLPLILMCMHLLILSRRIEMREEVRRANRTEAAAKQLIAYANAKTTSIDEAIPVANYMDAAARLADLIKGPAYARLIDLVQQRRWLQGPIRLAFHSNARRRFRAIRTLEGFNCPNARHALRQVMAGDSSAELRKLAALALLRFDGLPPVHDTISSLRMEEGNLGVTEISVLEALAKVDGAALEAATRSSCPELRNMVIASLGTCGDLRVFAMLLGWSRSRSAAKRLSVAAALERCQHRATDDTLLRLIGDVDPGVRKAALHSLVKRRVSIPDKEKERLLADPDPYIVSYAGFAWRRPVERCDVRREAIAA